MDGTLLRRMGRVALAALAVLGGGVGGAAAFDESPTPDADGTVVVPAPTTASTAPPTATTPPTPDDPAAGDDVGDVSPPVAEPEVVRDVAYGAAPAQRLDVHRVVGDAIDAEGRAPAVLLVHGGGWFAGDKRRLASTAAALARAGFVVFNANYTLATRGRPGFPTQLDELRQAIAWIRTHGARYGADPARLGVVGTSAGGTLAALLGSVPTRGVRLPSARGGSRQAMIVRRQRTGGATPAQERRASEQRRRRAAQRRQRAAQRRERAAQRRQRAAQRRAAQRRQRAAARRRARPAAARSRRARAATTIRVRGSAEHVRAVVTWSAPLDLSATAVRGTALRHPVARFVGCPRLACAARLASASPLVHAAGARPMLLVNGRRELVPAHQPLGMADALAANGIDHELVLIPGVRHGRELAPDALGPTIDFLRARL